MGTAPRPMTSRGVWGIDKRALMVKPTKLRKLWRWLLLIAVLTPVAVTTYTLLTLPDVSDLKTKNPSSTAFMRSRQEEARRKGRAIVIQKEWVDFAGIPELLKEP